MNQLSPALDVSRRGDDVELQLTAAARGDQTGAVEAIEQLLAAPEFDGARFSLAADHPPAELDPLPETVADAVGFTKRRDLHILRRPLPVPADHPARSAPVPRVRAFVPGQDDAAWLRANNAAFSAHPDQGRETPETLATRTAEPWFRPEDFLVGDDAGRPGELEGFCWTKRHAATEHDPELGEIYVIAVDPSHRGEGLGPGYVLAGLDHLAASGIGEAILYVDADNTPATALYDRLGFVLHHRRRVYTP